MTIDTLNFTGDTVTYLGFLGIISTAIILVTVFRSFYNSPLNKWQLRKQIKLFFPMKKE
jgi:hypothetical protein